MEACCPFYPIRMNLIGIKPTKNLPLDFKGRFFISDKLFFIFCFSISCRSGCRCFFIGSFCRFVCCRSGDDRHRFIVGSGANPFRQLEIAQMNGLADFQTAQIDFNEGGQFAWQTGDFQFRDGMMNNTRFFGRRCVFVDKVQRHFNVDFLVGVNTLEINVQYYRFVCMNLKKLAKILVMRNKKSLLFMFRVENLLNKVNVTEKWCLT